MIAMFRIVSLGINYDDNGKNGLWPGEMGSDPSWKRESSLLAPSCLREGSDPISPFPPATTHFSLRRYNSSHESDLVCISAFSVPSPIAAAGSRLDCGIHRKDGCRRTFVEG